MNDRTRVRPGKVEARGGTHAPRWVAMLTVMATAYVPMIATDAARAAPTAAPAGFAARFTGALKGAAQGGTSDGCVVSARPVDPDQAALTPSPLLLPRLITMQWSNFTVKRKPASMTLLVGAPIAGNPSEPTPIPWQPGAPTGAAELTVTTPSGNFVTTADAKPATSDVTTGLSVDVTLKAGKKTLRVKGSFDCTKAGTTGDVPTR